MNESKRVRVARALDAIEEVVRKCGEHLFHHAATTTHYMNASSFCIDGVVREAAREYGVHYDELKPEALRMLHEELAVTLDGLRVMEHRVEPYVKDGTCVGMKATFYIDLWKKARTA